MRELHAIMGLGVSDLANLKQKALLFDKFIAVSLHYPYFPNPNEFPDHLRADLEFLRSEQLVVDLPKDVERNDWEYTRTRWESIPREEWPHQREQNRADWEERFRTRERIVAEMMSVPKDEANLLRKESRRHKLAVDWVVRDYCASLNAKNALEVVPIYRTNLPVIAANSPFAKPEAMQNVLTVAMDALPTPDVDCPWEAILEFKAELHDRRWGFSRWLRNIATKQQEASEIRDEIEWLVNEYATAMKIYKIKASRSLVEAAVVTPIEIIESLVKLNFSTIAKGIFSVKKQNAELMQAEIAAPGRECAYVFEARRTFGP